MNIGPSRNGQELSRHLFHWVQRVWEGWRYASRDLVTEADIVTVADGSVRTGGDG